MRRDEDLRAVGMDGLAEKLNVYADVLSEAVETMDSSLGRSIKEDFDEGQRQIGETFKALLEAANRKESGDNG